MIKTVVIAGPTAAGKTEYAIEIARRIGGEIVSADSMQIYKYMDIGSAKPTAAERALAKHYLVDEIDPKALFSVSDYKDLALGYIEQIHNNGKIPIVCGGTGLYVNSLIYDMDFAAPKGNADYRKKLIESAENDPEKLHKRLEELDPKAAALIHPNNMLRVARYIERIELGETDFKAFDYSLRKSTVIDPVLLCISRERSLLYDRIDRRVDALYKAGLAEEVANLMNMGFTADDISMKGIGYKEIINAVGSGKNPEDASDEIKLNTRHLAKRQITWFKRIPDMKWFEPKSEAFDHECLESMLIYINNYL